MESIRVEDLTKIYGGGVVALDGLSFSVLKGTMVGFVGPNGAGKTTAFKILTGLIRPTSGRAFLNGSDVVKNHKGALKEVGAVVEVPEFYPFLTPIETLQYLGRLRGMKKKSIQSQATELLVLFGLQNNLNDRVGRFSKGMKQRLALAQAMLHEPSVLILDEPTNGLDPQGIIEMRKILLDLKKGGKTILMSSHMLSEIQDTCDRIIMIEHGKLLAHESMDDVEKHAHTNYYDVTLFEDLSDNALEDLKRIEGVRSVEAKSKSRLMVEIDPAIQGGNRLLNEIMSRGHHVESFGPHNLPLESFYVQKRKKAG